MRSLTYLRQVLPAVTASRRVAAAAAAAARIVTGPGGLGSRPRSGSLVAEHFDAMDRLRYVAEVESSRQLLRYRAILPAFSGQPPAASLATASPSARTPEAQAVRPRFKLARIL